jgi:hypothetical protein
MSILGNVLNLNPSPSLTYYICSIQTSLDTKKSSNGAKRKKLNSSLALKLEPSYGSTFFCSIRAFLDVEKSSNGQKKKVELGPGSKLGARPQLNLFFALSELLLETKETRIKQKK